MSDADAHLRLRRTGGLAGVALEAALDTASLQPAQRRAILHALDTADLDSLADTRSTAPGPPDAFGFELDVDRAGRSRRLHFTEDGAPPELQPVLDALAARAQPVRRASDR